jgi:hypothetical protein
LHIAHAVAGERGVGYGDAIDAACDKYARDWLEVVLGDVGGDLDDDRPLRLAGRGDLVASRQNARQQIVERGRRLQVAQPGVCGR